MQATTTTQIMNNSLRSLTLASIFLFLIATQVKANEIEAFLIPAKKDVAIVRWKEISKAINLPSNIEEQITEANMKTGVGDEGHLQYSLQVENIYRFKFDACSGNITLTTSAIDTALTRQEADSATSKWITETQVKARFEELKDTLLPEAKLAYFALTSGLVAYDSTGDKKSIKYRGLDESTASYIEYNEAALTSNHLVLALNRSNGQVEMMVLTDVKFPNLEAGKLGAISYNSIQENLRQMHDGWFISNVLVIKGLDSEQLRFVESQNYFNYYDKYNLHDDECLVTFNGQLLTSTVSLFFRPKVREGNPLIFADYFPNFLIDTKRDGNTITLNGQLPDKGKTAILTIGSKDAIVDGKPFALSGAPQEIEGRLYLPYELLHECNGVLVRWDAKKNTLWVDTRYLRRP